MRSYEINLSVSQTQDFASLQENSFSCVASAGWREPLFLFRAVNASLVRFWITSFQAICQWSSFPSVKITIKRAESEVTSVFGQADRVYAAELFVAFDKTLFTFCQIAIFFLHSEEYSLTLFMTQWNSLTQIIQTDVKINSGIWSKIAWTCEIGPPHRWERFSDLFLSGIQRERSHSMPDRELYEHFSPPTIDCTIDNFEQIHDNVPEQIFDFKSGTSCWRKKYIWYLTSLGDATSVLIRNFISRCCLSYGSRYSEKNNDSSPVNNITKRILRFCGSHHAWVEPIFDWIFESQTFMENPQRNIFGVP
jgi:hypothetical protein